MIWICVPSHVVLFLFHFDYSQKTYVVCKHANLIYNLSFSLVILKWKYYSDEILQQQQQQLRHHNVCWCLLFVVMLQLVLHPKYAQPRPGKSVAVPPHASQLTNLENYAILSGMGCPQSSTYNLQIKWLIWKPADLEFSKPAEVALSNTRWYRETKLGLGRRPVDYCPNTVWLETIFLCWVPPPTHTPILPWLAWHGHLWAVLIGETHREIEFTVLKLRSCSYALWFLHHGFMRRIFTLVLCYEYPWIVLRSLNQFFQSTSSNHYAAPREVHFALALIFRSFERSS